MSTHILRNRLAFYLMAVAVAGLGVALAIVVSGPDTLGEKRVRLSSGAIVSVSVWKKNEGIYVSAKEYRGTGGNGYSTISHVGRAQDVGEGSVDFVDQPGDRLLILINGKQVQVDLLSGNISW